MPTPTPKLLLWLSRDRGPNVTDFFAVVGFCTMRLPFQVLFQKLSALCHISHLRRLALSERRGLFWHPSVHHPYNHQRCRQLHREYFKHFLSARKSSGSMFAGSVNKGIFFYFQRTVSFASVSSTSPLTSSVTLAVETTTFVTQTIAVQVIASVTCACPFSYIGALCEGQFQVGH